MSTTSFGGGGGGGSYKTTAFILGAFNSELGVDNKCAGMRSLRTSLFSVGVQSLDALLPYRTT